jgi:hypothetical protein
MANAIGTTVVQRQQKVIHRFTTEEERGQSMYKGEKGYG